MSIDNLLRDYARQDLQRLCPVAHDWLREHDPMADRELTEPLLREPRRFGLTPRERVAATALGDLTTYTIRSRAILGAAYPARDLDAPILTTGMTPDQEREIAARREVHRRSALEYARMLGDEQLIECYQTSATNTASAQTAATLAPVPDGEWVTQAQARAIVKESRELDRYPSQENLGYKIAAEFRWPKSARSTNWPPALPHWRCNVATLKTRLAALEVAIVDDGERDGFDFAPVMPEAEWCEAAAKQQAELCREVLNGAP